MLILSVKNQMIKIKSSIGIGDPLVSNSKGEYECSFEFDDSWNGFINTAVFEISDKYNHKKSYELRLINNNKCIIPSSILIKNSYLRIGVFGKKGEIDRPTVYSKALLIKEGAIASDKVPDPEPSIYLELMELISDLDLKVDSINQVPTGGTKGQVLSKNSDADNDVSWSSLAEVTTSWPDIQNKPFETINDDEFKVDNSSLTINHVVKEKIIGLNEELKSLIHTINFNGKNIDNLDGKCVLMEEDPTVPAWAKQPNKPEYTALEVGALSIDTKIPSKTSDLDNDVGFLTEHQSLNGYAKESYVNDKIEQIIIPKQLSELSEDVDHRTVSDFEKTDWNSKQPKGDYLKSTEISDWAKQSNKPTYTADEVGALSKNTIIPSKTSDLTNDSGFLTEHQSLIGYAKESYVNQKISEIEVPTQLSELGDDPTHRTVTDEEKKKWNSNSGGSSDYNDIVNKPSINDVELIGNITTEQLGIKDGKTPVKGVDYFTNEEINTIEDNAASKVVVPKALSDLTDDSTHRVVTDVEKQNWDNKQDSGNYLLDSDISDWAKQPKKPKYIASEVGALPDDTEIPNVPAWAMEPQKPSYTAEEVKALPNTTSIPKNTSDLNNDSGFLTQHQSLEGYAKETYVAEEINKIQIPKQLSDLTDDVNHRTVTDIEKQEWNNKQPSGDYSLKADTAIIQLSETSWVDNNQKIQNPIFKTGEQYIYTVSPVPSDIENYSKSGIMAIEVDNTGMTFKCLKTPIVPLNVNISVMEAKL